MLTGCKQRQHGIEVVAQANGFISHDALEFWTEIQKHPEQARRFRPRNGRMYYVQARRGEEALWTGYFDRKSKARAFWQALEKGTFSFDLRHSPLPSFDEWLRYEPDVTFYWFGTQALTGTSASIQTWAVDATWNNARNSVQVIGPGGNGAARQSSTVGGCGGGAGEFTKRNNVALTPSGTMYYLLPAGGSVIDALANDTNLTLQSETFDDGANWSDTVGATITANSTANPVDGSVNADSLVEDGTTGNHLRGSSFQTIFANQTHIVSLYVQAGIRSAVEVRCFATGYANYFSCAFDLSNQTVVTSTAGSGVVAGQSITPLANNWFRVAVWGTLDAVSTTASTYIYATNGSISYTGSNGSTALIIFGAQRNYGSTLKSYVRTTTAETYSNLAKAGTNATTSAAGAHQTGGQGDTVNEGGDGFKPLTGNAVGGGGGGAAGPNGAGSTSSGSTGGAADNSTVTQPTSTNVNGVAGIEFGTQGSGTGASGTSGAGNGFTGGLYGGGGSGCGTDVAGAGGSGAQSIIFLTWSFASNRGIATRSQSFGINAWTRHKLRSNRGGMLLRPDFRIGQYTRLPFSGAQNETSEAASFVSWWWPAALGGATGRLSVTGEANSVKAGRAVSNDAGFYTLTGKADTLLFGRKAAVNSGFWTVTGEAVSALAARKLAMNTGFYVLTGESSNLKLGHLISALTGFYNITGEADSLLRGSKVAANTGFYSITGEAASLLSGRKVSANTGFYTITGESVRLLKGYLLLTNTGLYSLNGIAVTLTAVTAKRLFPDAGLYNLTGETVTLLKTSRLPLSAGFYSLTGEAVALKHGYLVSANTGFYSLTGIADRLLRAASLAASTGFYTVNGKSIILLKGSKLGLDTGFYQLTGEAAQTLASHVLAAQSGKYTLTGESVVLHFVRTLAAQSGKYSLTGESVSFRKTSVLAPQTGFFVIAGKNATLIFGSRPTILASPNLLGEDAVPSLSADELAVLNDLLGKVG